MIRCPLNRLMQRFDSRQKSIDRSGPITTNVLRDCTTWSCARQWSRDDGAKRNQHADRANEDWSRRKYKARKKSVGAKTENEGQRQLELKHAWTQKWFVQTFGNGLICPRAQTCMGSKVVRADFWQRIDLPPGSNMLRLAYADSGSACKLAGVQIIPLPTLANQILARTFFRSVANLFACPAVGKFSRASSAGGRRHLQ